MDECSSTAVELNEVERMIACGVEQLSETVEVGSFQEDQVEGSEEAKEIQHTNLESSKCQNYLNDIESASRIKFLQTIVDNSFHHAQTGLDRNFDCLKEVFEELLQGRQKCLEEMTTNAKNLKSILQSALSINDEKRRTGLIYRLEACFNAGHWMDLSFKPKCVDDCKASMEDFVSSSFGGVNNIKAIFAEYLGSKSAPLQECVSQPHGRTYIEPFLVNVTAVENPGSFYIVRYCDMNFWRSLFNWLKENAHSFPAPEEIVVGEQYAVRNSSGNWFRGVCRKVCGDF